MWSSTREASSMSMRETAEKPHGAIAGKADDPGAVGEEQGDRIVAITARADDELRHYMRRLCAGTRRFGAQKD